MHLKKIEILNLWGKAPLEIKFDNRVTFLTGINGSGKSSVLNIIYDSLSIHKDMPATSKNRFWSTNATFDNNISSYSCIFPLPESKEVILEKFENERHFHKQELLEELESLYISDKEELVKSVRYNEELKGHSAKFFLEENGQAIPSNKHISKIPNLFIFQEDRECLHSSEKTNGIVNFSSFLFYKNSIDERFAYIRESFAIYESRTSKRIEDILLKKEIISIEDLSNEKDHSFKSALQEIQEKSTILNYLNKYMELSGKKVCRDKENKITLCKLNDNTPINWSLLSRGEKTLIYLFLVAFIYKDSIFLLDEPEISLHVEWQKTLIRDLSQIAPTSQFIIATHSPTLIREGWVDNCLNIKI